eukprot:6349820-Amphidinium_carterae.1
MDNGLILKDQNRLRTALRWLLRCVAVSVVAVSFTVVAGGDKFTAHVLRRAQVTDEIELQSRQEVSPLCEKMPPWKAWIYQGRTTGTYYNLYGPMIATIEVC